MRIKALICICIASLLLLGGCWDNTDIGKQNYAMVVSLCGNIGKVNGSIQCSDPTSPEASEDNSNLLEIKGSGVNISSFIGDAEKQSDKLVTYEHLQLIVLSPEFFTKNTLNCMQYFMSRAEVQKTADIIISDSDISQMLSTTINNKPMYKHICGMLASDTVTTSAILLDSSLISLCRLQKDGHSYRINKINFDDTSKDVYWNGFGVFSGEKFNGYVDREYAEYARWFGMESGNFYLSCLMEGENEPVGFRCISSKSKVSAKKEGDSFYLKVKVNADFRLNEYEQKDSTEPFNPEFYNRAENAICTAVSSQCKKVAELAQTELKVDFLGFSRAVENEYPDWWEENHDKWNTFFSVADIQYDIKCSLITTGDLK